MNECNITPYKNHINLYKINKETIIIRFIITKSNKNVLGIIFATIESDKLWEVTE